MSGFPEVTFSTRVAGTSFRQKDIDSFYEDNSIELKREPNNPQDPNAVSIIHEETGKPVGYIPREVARTLAIIMDAGYYVNGCIKHTTGGYSGKPTKGVVVEVNIDGELMEDLARGAEEIQ